MYRDRTGCTGSTGNKFYLYRGQSFTDKGGYQLIMMAKHFPMKNEVRIYTVNDVGSTEKGNAGLLSSQMRIRKANSMRVEKATQLGFDFDNSHIAKLCINEKIKGGTKTKEFVIKNRYCLYCSKYPFYFCQQEKEWEFQQELGTFIIVSKDPYCYLLRN